MAVKMSKAIEKIRNADAHIRLINCVHDPMLDHKKIAREELKEAITELEKEPVHFLISCKQRFMAGLYYRACDSSCVFSTKDRNKKQGSFSRKNVNCCNCKQTNAFKQALKWKAV